MKRAAIVSLTILAIATPAAAQSILRQRFEQAGNQIGQLFAGDKRDAELRTLRGAQALNISLIEQKRVEIERLTLELEQIERRLVDLGEAPYLPAAPAAPIAQVNPFGAEPIITCELLGNGQCAPAD